MPLLKARHPCELSRIASRLEAGKGGGMILIFDTETTGKADFSAPGTAPHQPHLVQIAALLLDDDLSERQTFCYIIKPEGFAIPKEASDIHGITTEIATHCGISLQSAMGNFLELWSRAHLRTAHNLDFDEVVITKAFADLREVEPIAWMEGKQARFCTMKQMTPVCNLPGPYGPKWPKLSEAYQHVTGKALDDAHDALVDVRACATIYRWLFGREVAR